jgi:MtrB/PioB family decaheme-associated outer membrane protein
MRRNKNTLAAAVTAALITPATALAQVDTSDWNCEYCPFDDGYSAEYEAGASHVSDDALRHGNGTGYDEKGAYAELGGEGRYFSNGTEVEWFADDLGLDSRLFALSAGRPGKYSIDFGYRAIPYRLFGSTSTVYTIGGGDLSSPSAWTTAPTTSGFSDLGTSLQPVNIETDREILEFGLSYLPTRDVSTYAGFRRQQRDGIEITAGGGFTQAGFLPRVIDDYTDEIDAGITFKVGELNLALAYYGSFYSNDIESLTWDHLYTAFSPDNRGRTATEPDNDFQQFSLSGVYRMDAMNTVVAFSVAAGEGEQNANLLPYTINTALPVTPLPVSTLGGKVDTSNYAFTLTSKPFNKARIKLSYRFDERDNQTPVSTWTRVITDTFATVDLEQNVPYSFERSRWNLSGSYRLFDSVTVSGGYDYTDLQRDFQEVADQTEETGWGKVRWRPTNYLEATFKGGESTREIDEYDETVAAGFGQNPLMRKYYLAHRYREFAEVSLSASLPERPLSVGITYFWADDSYTQSDLGMTASEEQRYAVDFSWAASDKSTIYLMAGNESIDATQLGSENFAGPVWTAAHDDDFNHFGGGLHLSGLGEKVDLVLDYSHSEGETEILYSGMNVSAAVLPALESTMDSLRLTLSYQWSERLSTDFVARWETFETADWALDGVLVDTLPTVLTMGATSYDYDVWAFGISFRYRMGAD